MGSHWLFVGFGLVCRNKSNGKSNAVVTRSVDAAFNRGRAKYGINRSEEEKEEELSRGRRTTILQKKLAHTRQFDVPQARLIQL